MRSETKDGVTTYYYQEYWERTAPSDFRPRSTVVRYEAGQPARTYVRKGSPPTVNGQPVDRQRVAQAVSQAQSATAYHLAVQAGFVGTAGEWLDHLAGPLGGVDQAMRPVPKVVEVDVMTQFRQWEDDFIARNLALANEDFHYGIPDKVYIPPDILAIRNTSRALIVAAVLLVWLVLVTLAAA